YDSATSLYLYVNTAAQETLQPLLDFIVSDQAQTVLIDREITAPSFYALESNQRIVSGELDGRVFSREEVEFQIPANLTGQVNVAGSGSRYDYLKSVADSITGSTAQQVQVDQINFAVNFKMDGDAAGIRRLCNGEADVIVITGALSDEQ